MAGWIDALAEDAPLKRFGAGERVFTRDDPASEMFIVLRGEIEIVSAGVILERVRPGGIFGELALIDGGSRSATAKATTDTEIAVLERQTFLDLVRKRPELALDVMRTLAARLRRMDESI